MNPFSPKLLPLNPSTERALARDPQTRFHGVGESRDMATQSGQTVPLLQEAMMQEGGMYTLVFGLLDPGVPVECVATITASERGNSVQRQLNIVKGASISIAGRVFDVRVTDTTPETLPLSATATPGAGTGYVVSCLIERGNRPSEGRPPTLYGGIASLATHTSETVPIPQNAGVISLEVSVAENVTFPTVTPNVVVTFTTASGGIFKVYNPVLQSGFVDIPPGATEVTITNADAANGVYATITWGIDG
jgi:hypothetical protein